MICNLEEVAERGTNHTITQLAPRNTISTNEALLVYPNPTNGAKQLNIPNGMSLKQISISDMYGRIVRRQVSGTSIDLSGLGKGSYIVQMIGSSGERISNKLVIN